MDNFFDKETYQQASSTSESRQVSGISTQRNTHRLQSSIQEKAKGSQQKPVTSRQNTN